MMGLFGENEFLKNSGRYHQMDFWFTIKGYLIYLLTKFEDLVPTSLGSGPFLIFGGFYRKA